MRVITRNAEAGETLVTLIVSIGLAAVLFSVTMTNFLNATRAGYDHELRLRAMEEASAVLDLMAYDLRMMGSGMPLGQSGFRIEDLTLGETTLPAMLDATDSHISFRMNEWGATSLLTADFNPANGSIINVFSTERFKTGNTLFINNVSTGGSEGLAAPLSAIVGNTLTLGGMTYSPGAVFRAGSLVNRVALITYDAPADLSGITRNAGDGGASIVLAPRSTFSLQYFNMVGGAVALPLTRSSIANELAALRLTVRVQGENPLRDGSIYTAEASQNIGLRDLNISR